MAFPLLNPSKWVPNIKGYYSLLVDGDAYEVENAQQTWSLSSTDDNAIRFELRAGDYFSWDVSASGHGAQRTEIADRVKTPDGTPVEASYSFEVDPGAKNTASWLVLGQLHPGDDFTAPKLVGPPFEVALSGERMQINIVSVDAQGDPFVKTLYTDTSDIVRGQFYDMDVKAVFDPTGNGRLVVVRDGVTLVDYTGSLGYANQTGVVWHEGIYRSQNATETISATFKDLNITSGSSVSIPDPSEFIAAPVLSVASIALQANGTYLTKLAGTAKANTTVSVFEGTQLLGTAQAGANGAFALSLNLAGVNEQFLSAVAVDATGRSGISSVGMAVEIGTAADIMNRLSAIAAQPSLGAIVVTDTSVLPVVSANAMRVLIQQDAGAFAKIQGPYSFKVTIPVSGKSYDTQVELYASTGVLTERMRYRSGTLVFDDVYAGDGSHVFRNVNGLGGWDTATYAADGFMTSYMRQLSNGGLNYNQVFNRDCSTSITYYGSDGKISSYSSSNADKSSISVTLGIKGQPYSIQVYRVNSAGVVVSQERYSAVGSLVWSNTLNADGSRTVANFDATTGRETSYSISYINGTSVQGKYGIIGKPYTTQVTTYSKTGVVLSTATSSDVAPIGASSSVVFTLLNGTSPTSGALPASASSDVATGPTTTTQTNADGSRTVTVFQPGSTTLPASVTTYNAAGAKLSTDVFATGGGDLLTTFDPVSGQATATTQTNADGSMIVTALQAGSTTLPASIGTYNAAGAKLSTDVFAAGGGHLLTTFDPATGLAIGTTQTNPDGSRVVTAFQAGSATLPASITVSNAAGATLSTDVFEVSGGYLLTTFDPANGLATGTTQTNANGSKVVTAFQPGSATLRASFNAFDPVGTLIETDSFNAAGALVSTALFGPDGSDLLTAFDPVSGLATGTTDTDADGSKVVTAFQQGSATLRASVNSFDPSGTLMETDLSNAAGVLVSTDVFATGGGDLLSTFDPASGLATGTTQTNADGSKVVTAFQAGSATLPASITVSNAAGVTLSTDVFATGGGDLLTTFDPASGLATGTTQTNADGSKVVTAFQAGSATLPASITVSNAAGVLVSTDVFAAGGGDLLTTFDPASGLVTGTTQTNVDGSKVVTAFQPGSATLPASVTVSNAAGVTLSTDVFAMGGGHLLTTFDPASGLVTGTTQTNADGSKVVTAFQAGSATLPASITVSNAAGVLVSTDVFAGGGGDLLTTFDPASGLATGTTQTNVDGSKVVTAFQPGSATLPASITVSNAAGVILSTDVFATGGGDLLTTFDPASGLATGTQTNADGSKVVTAFQAGSATLPASITVSNAAGVLVSTDVFAAGGGDLLTTFDPASGLVTGTTQTNADGSKVVTAFQAGSTALPVSVNSYDTDGTLLETDGYNAAGVLISTDVFAAGGGGLLTTLNPASGLATGTTQTNADGSKVVTAFQRGSATLRASVNSFDASGRLVETDTYTGKGVLSAAKAWGSDGSVKTYRVASGLKTGFTLVATDGSKQVVVFQPGNEALFTTSTFYNAAGAVTEIDAYNAAGQKTKADQRNSDGSRVLSNFNTATGALVWAQTRYANGAITTMNYAVTGQAYTQQALTSDPTTGQTSLTRWYGDANRTVAMTSVTNADGSSEIHSYDTAGREMSRTLAAVDGSKDVINSTYAGALSAPTTVQQFHYAAGNQQVWTDTTAADGSHKQVARAAGVSLTSHAGVADTFTAAGNNTFVFQPAFGQDIVTNFHAGAGANHDTLDLGGLGLPVGAGQSSLDALTQAIKQIGRDALITLTPTDTITLKNTLVSAITKEDLRVA